MKKNKLINLANAVSFIIIGLAILGFVIIFFQFIFVNKKPENFGVFGNALSGVLNPIIAIAGALLTFIAFYIQKLANDELKRQFLHQQNKENQDFIFKNYKERILLIISEINNFNISFHKGTLISNTDLLNNTDAKKYNFLGIQAINLFLIEYFKIKNNQKSKINIEDSYHSILLHINNIIIAFYNIHISIEECNLEDDYKNELQELLYYTYFSKFNYFLEFLKSKDLEKNLKFKIDYIYDSYKRS